MLRDGIRSASADQLPNILHAGNFPVVTEPGEMNVGIGRENAMEIIPGLGVDDECISSGGVADQIHVGDVIRYLEQFRGGRWVNSQKFLGREILEYRTRRSLKSSVRECCE